MGKIPRINNFESKEPSGLLKRTSEPDFVEDDSSLVLKTQKGLVIITGCAHSGIMNICEYAKRVCNNDKIHSIIGGLHLKSASKEKIDKTVEYIKSLKLYSLYACHCTGFEAQCLLKDYLKETGSGSMLVF